MNSLMNLLLLLPLFFGLASSTAPAYFAASELDQIETTAVNLLENWSAHPSFASQGERLGEARRSTTNPPPLTPPSPLHSQQSPPRAKAYP